MLLFSILLIGANQAPPDPADMGGSSGTGECRLTDADLTANARLSFAQFDQQGITPSTARQLGDRGCFAEAARATEHWLVNGPVLERREHSAALWHLGQYLAAAGEEQRAALVMAGARRPVEPADELDWNSYVAGTWAFLTRDRALLEDSVRRLRAAPQPRNANNLAALERLLRCFGQSYADSYFGEACRARGVGGSTSPGRTPDRN